MKILHYFALTLISIQIFSAELSADQVSDAKQQNAQLAVVNFKTCVERSKLGKEEQANFEVLRNQMENSLEEKERVLTDLSNKFNDADYLDSLSPETETNLKRQFRQLSQELNQVQGQYYQTLNQANMKVVQKLHEAVVVAAKSVAEQKNIDIVFSEEGTFFYNPKLDISNDVIAVMDKVHDLTVNSAQEAN